MNSTQDYVNNSFGSREEDAKELLQAMHDGTEYEGEDAQDAAWNFPLAVDRKVLVTVEISCGGPAEWIDAICEPGSYGELQVQSASFHAAWGSNSHRETRLTESDALFQLAEYYVSSMEV